MVYHSRKQEYFNNLSLNTFNIPLQTISSDKDTLLPNEHLKKRAGHPKTQVGFNGYSRLLELDIPLFAHTYLTNQKYN